MISWLVGRTTWIDTWSISFHQTEGNAEAGNDTFNCAFVVSDTWQVSQQFGDATYCARERMSGVCSCKLLVSLVESNNTIRIIAMEKFNNPQDNKG